MYFLLTWAVLPVDMGCTSCWLHSAPPGPEEGCQEGAAGEGGGGEEAAEHGAPLPAPPGQPPAGADPGRPTGGARAGPPGLPPAAGQPHPALWPPGAGPERFPAEVWRRFRPGLVRPGLWGGVLLDRVWGGLFRLGL